MGINIEIVLPEDLLTQVRVAKTRGMGSELKDFNTAFTDENKHEINFIITLGGDGTILWAAK